MSIRRRIDKLEQAHKNGALALPADASFMTDAQLFEVILQGCGMPSTASDVAAHLDHFNVTGELPTGAMDRSTA